MRLVFLLVLSSIISACASPGELLDRDPQLSFETKKQADVFAACLSDALTRTTGNVSYVPTETGYRIIMPHPNAGADAVTEVIKTDSGAKIRHIERMPALMGSWVQEAVIGCK